MWESYAKNSDLSKKAQYSKELSISKTTNLYALANGMYRFNTWSTDIGEDSPLYQQQGIYLKAEQYYCFICENTNIVWGFLDTSSGLIARAYLTTGTRIYNYYGSTS
jgi:hypothetical protein